MRRVLMSMFCFCLWFCTFPSVSAEELSPEQQVLRLVNEEREAHGAQALLWNAPLAAVARLRVQETLQKFSHTRPDGSRCFTLLKEQGIRYRTAGENLVRGTNLLPVDAVRLWLDSPTHCRNIRMKSYTHTGIACIEGPDGKTYYIELFIEAKP